MSDEETVKRMQAGDRTHVRELDEIPQVVASPRDVAQDLGITPQLVYYYIRTGKVEALECLCGRTVVDTTAAKQALSKGQGSRGQDVEASSED